MPLLTRQQALEQLQTYPTDIQSQLKTLVMGVDYAARRDQFVADYETTGIPGAPWPGLLSDETVDLDEDRLFVRIVDAATEFFQDAGAAARAAGGPNRVLHDAGATIFAGTDRSGSVPYDVQPGDLVFLTDGTVELYTTVVDLLWVAGEPTVLVLADNVPTAMPALFDLSIARSRQRTLEEGEYAASTEELTVVNDLMASIVSGGATYPIISWPGKSRVFVDYRARRVDNMGDPLIVSTQQQIDQLFIGSQYPESGLGFAVRRALLVERDTQPVMAVVVADESEAAWEEELTRVRSRLDWFAVAPVSADPDVQALFIALVSERREAEYPCELFISLPLHPIEVLWEGLEVVAVDDSLTPGEDRTVTSSNAFAGAQPGSRVTIDDQQYLVEEAVSTQTVITSTVVGAGAYELTQVETDRTVSEQAAELGSRASMLQNQDVFVVFPDEPQWYGQTVEAHHLCAAIAGLRGISIAQRPLRRTALESGWLAPQSRWEFAGQLELLRDMGVLVVTSDQAGATFVVHDSSTDQTDDQTSRETMVANIAIAERQYKLLVMNYEGTFRATQEVFDRIRNRAVQLTESLKTNTVVQPYDAMIVSAAVGPVTEIMPETDPGRIVLPVGLVISSLVKDIAVQTEITIATVNQEAPNG